MSSKEEIQLVIHDFPGTTTKFMTEFQNNSDFADVTLACDDFELVPAHKVILSAGSIFFRTVLKKLVSSYQPLLYLRGVSRDELEVILTFLYTGQTRVHNQGLDSFLILARDLGISGFSGKKEEEEEDIKQTDLDDPYEIKEMCQAEPLIDAMLSVKHEVEETFEAEKSNQTMSEDNHQKSKSKNTEIEILDKHLVVNPESFKLKVKSTKKLLKKSIDYTSNPNQPTNQRPNHSPVWKFAKKLDLTKCICNFCGKVVLTRCSSTTHIRNHLLKDHSDIPEVVRAIPIAKSHAENRQQYNSLVWKYCVMKLETKQVVFCAIKLFYLSMDQQQK